MANRTIGRLTKASKLAINARRRRRAAATMTSKPKTLISNDSVPATPIAAPVAVTVIPIVSQAPTEDHAIVRRRLALYAQNDEIKKRNIELQSKMLDATNALEYAIQNKKDTIAELKKALKEERKRLGNIVKQRQETVNSMTSSIRKNKKMMATIEAKIEKLYK